MAGGRRAAKAPRVDPPATAEASPAADADADAVPPPRTTTTMPSTTSILAAPSAAAVAASEATTAIPWLDDFWGSADADVAAACACGVLEVSSSGGKSAATRLFHRYPLRLLVPKRVTAPDADAVWCYSVGFVILHRSLTTPSPTQTDS